ncbi:hypothetical protein K2X30_10295 [bacterium]|jgi:4-alpha-glucanotransferase|nr:hypothetical protein [bacterium]
MKKYLILTFFGVLSCFTAFADTTVYCTATQVPDFKATYKFVHTQNGLEIWESGKLKEKDKHGSIAQKKDSSTNYYNLVTVVSDLLHTNFTVKQKFKDNVSSYYEHLSEGGYILDDHYDLFECRVF